MKILILSNSEWNDSNSFGSSFSNIFGNIEELEIANIYCRTGKPKTNSCSHFFQMTEKMLLKNILNAEYPTGKAVYSNDISGHDTADTFTEQQQSFVDFVKKKRWISLFWLRDIVWFLGRWKSKQLISFIDEFNPDIIFLPVYYSVYLNEIGLFLKYHSNRPMVGYISDDNYTLKQFSISPFFWFDRFIKRRWVRKAIDQCEILYVISDIQKQDYDKCFGKDCKILFKGGEFNENIPIKEKLNKPINLVYAGNMGSGRYKSLSKIGNALDKINENETKAILNIYSYTPISRKIKSAFLGKKSIKLHGGVSLKEIIKIFNSADILVHAESFHLKERLQVRQSFSSKIVDYFQAARCIFAVGWCKAASIDYLVKNNAAIVAFSEADIEDKLRRLLDSPHLIIDYGKKSWECGKRNHQLSKIQQDLFADLLELSYK